MNAALPNLIAVNWSPDRGGHHISAVIDDVLERCQGVKVAEAPSRRRSSRASVSRSPSKTGSLGLSSAKSGDDVTVAERTDQRTETVLVV